MKNGKEIKTLGAEHGNRYPEKAQRSPLPGDCQGVSGPRVRYHRGRENEDLDEGELMSLPSGHGCRGSYSKGEIQGAL